MSSPWLYAMTVGPLGFYLWLLGVWHSRRHPTVVAGLLDFALLASALGGVLVFGPFGQFAVRRLAGEPGPVDWLVVASGLGLVASVAARRSLTRLVVYHVDPAVLTAALEDVLKQEGNAFQRTLVGYEDPARGLAVTVDLSPWLRSAVVETRGRGPDAERFVQALRLRLRARLAVVNVGPSAVAFALYGLSMLVMLLPLMTIVLTQPRAREVLRVWLERLRGM